METIETLATELIDLVKTLAPEVWQIFIKKATYEGTALTIIGFLFFTIPILVWLIVWTDAQKTLKSKNECYDFDDDAWCLVLLVPFLLSIVMLYYGVLYLVIPEFRAIEIFLSSLGG